MRFFGGETVEWSVAERGIWADFKVRQVNKGDGLYKAYAIGAAGNCLLGTLIPEGEDTVLRRTLRVDSLKRQGVWPVTRVECRLVHTFSGTESSIPWRDEILRRSASRLPCHTVRRSGEDFVLSVPFDPCMPFPLVPLFCLSRVENGRVFFFFRKDGTPYIFRSDGKNRKESEPEGGNHRGKSDHQGTGGAGGSAGL